MRSIAIMNQKGGVGKTTSSVNLAAALSTAERRVLLVDLDPQAHATLHLGLDPAGQNASVYDVLVSGARAEDVIVKRGEHLHILPAHLDLVAAELELGGQAQREHRLSRGLQGVADRYDFVLIDCPPSLGVLTVNALTAVQEVCIPLQPHFFALQGLGKLLETVTLVQSVLNSELRVGGVVLCMYESGTRLAQEVDRDVRDFMAKAAPGDPWYGGRVYETRIRRNIKLAECPSFGQTIFEYAAGSNGAEDYSALARELLNGHAAAAQGNPAAKTRDVAEVTGRDADDPAGGEPAASDAPGDDPRSEAAAPASKPPTWSG